MTCKEIFAYIARVHDRRLFVSRGTQKLFGWFEGPGIEGASQMMEKLELHPPRRTALAASLAETAGGALLALGALTPLGGALITSTMTTAIRKVHGPKGPWNMQGGYEYNLVLIAAAIALVEGTAWAIAALATGVAGSTLAIEAAKRLHEEHQAAEEQLATSTRFKRETSAPEGEPVRTPA